MKTRITITLLIFCLLLSACGGTPAEDSQPAQGHESPEQPRESALPQPDICDSAISVDDRGIFSYIPNTRVEQGLQQNMLLYGKNLLLWGTVFEGDSAEYSLCLISTADGSVLADRRFESAGIAHVQLCGEKIAFCDWESGDILLLDDALEIAAQYRVEMSGGSVYLSEDGGFAYYLEPQSGIARIDLENGSREAVLTDCAYLLASGLCGNLLSFSYTDRATQLQQSAVLSLSDGRVSAVPFSEAAYDVQCSGELWLACGSEGSYFFGRSGRPRRLIFPEGVSTVSLLSENDRILTASYSRDGSSSLRLYAPDGSYISSGQLSAEASGLYYDPVWSEAHGGYFFTRTGQDGRDRLYFWDLSIPSQGADLELAAFGEADTAGSAVSTELYSKAAELSDKYGVEIFIAEKALTQHVDYEITQELDEALISKGLAYTEAALAAFPEGFFKQLMFGSYKHIELHLSGKLSRSEPASGELSFTNFTGFADKGEGKLLVVVDISQSGSPQRTLYHELAHLIEYKLSFDAELREGALFSEENWNSLNPEGFSYPNSYTGLSNSLYSDGNEAWFIDLYSRTFSSEDRARILEYAISGDSWCFAASPGRLSKLEYLCTCIKDCFDSSSWSVLPPWEQTLANCGIRLK